MKEELKQQDLTNNKIDCIYRHRMCYNKGGAQLQADFGRLCKKVDIIENGTDWIAIYQPPVVQSEFTKVHQCNLRSFTYKETECCKYKNLQEIVDNHKYDLIIIDDLLEGKTTLPCSSVLDIIKNHNLADDFIIIFDDTECKGEQNTSSQAIALLKEQNIEPTVFYRAGIKAQTFITSQSKSFIQFL